MSAVAEAVADGRIGGRLWLYTNYHCNLRCAYCLTESAPGRGTARARCGGDARERSRGSGAGLQRCRRDRREPFLLDWLPEALAEVAHVLPAVVLSNDTLFTGRRLAALEPLAGLPVQIQISLDSVEPHENDEMRGANNFARVVAAIPALVERGIGVRGATTLEAPATYDPAEMERCAHCTDRSRLATTTTLSDR